MLEGTEFWYSTQGSLATASDLMVLLHDFGVAARTVPSPGYNTEKDWNCPLKEVVESSSLEVFKTWN